MSIIQWFPGHMAKANRQMEEQLKLVDIVIELRDARCPLASFNPSFDKMFSNKPRLIILNKADLADEFENNKWLNHFNLNNTLLIDSKHDNLSIIITKKVQEILKDKIDKAKAKGIRKKVLRCMVVGIPNVGKSTFINSIVKRKVAKVENRPGVTKVVSWINLNDDISLLDTPGVLWPKFDNQDQAKILALIGSINDDVLDKKELCEFGINYLIKEYPNVLNNRYLIDEDKDNLINEIGLNKNLLSKNNVVDESKTIELFLNDIRNNKLGRITFEKC